MTSNEFTIEENALLSFDWSVSSYTFNYLYVTVRNLDNNTIIGGNKDGYSISGITRGTEYENLIYDTKEIELTPGKYRVEFAYYRRYSNDLGLDTGYVRNVKVISKDKTVKTDKDGKIRLSLVEGLYKATETQPLEGYATPELYTGIGIGESKEAEYDLKVELENLEMSGFDLFTDVVTIKDWIVVLGVNTDNKNVILLKCDLSGNIEWEKVEKNYPIKGLTELEDGIVAVLSSGEVVKYDLEGNIVWKNIEKRL